MPDANRPDARTPESLTDARRQLMQDSSHDFLGLLDLSGTVLEVNQRVGALHNLRREGLVGHPIWESPFWQFEARARLQQAVDQAGAGGYVRHDLHIEGSEGQQLTVDFSVGPVHDEQGVIVYLVAEGHDRTELHRLEAALEAQRVFLQAVLDNVADGIVACDTEGVLTCSSGSLRLRRPMRRRSSGAAQEYAAG